MQIKPGLVEHTGEELQAHLLIFNLITIAIALFIRNQDSCLMTALDCDVLVIDGANETAPTGAPKPYNITRPGMLALVAAPSATGPFSYWR